MTKASALLIDLMEYSLPQKARFHNGTEYVLEDALAEAAKTLKKPKLVFKTKASHSGVLINQRVYPGVHMKSSTKYWLQDYGKPLLDQHPDAPSLLSSVPKEPKILGRVAKANYYQLLTDSLFLRDFESPQPPGSDGSGYTELKCWIGDSATIEEVLDGRKLTLSVGMRPSKLICSICKKDWLSDGKLCEHEPGKIYEIENSEKSGKFLAYAITGTLKYHHLAFTWRPADTKAQVESVELADSQNKWKYFHEGPTKDAGNFTGFRLVDSESGSFLDMDLASLHTMSDMTNHSQEKDKVRTEPAIELRQEVLANSEEDSMSQEVTTVPDAPKPADATPQTSDPAATETKPAENLADNYYWSQPDPKDGHTHAVEKLDKDGTGVTTSGGKPAHKHDIKYGRVLPFTPDGGAYSSRHPGTYYLDSESNTMSCEITSGDTADGKPIEKPQTNEEPKAEDTETADTGFDTEDKNPNGVEVMGEVELKDHEEWLDWYASHPEDKELQDAKLTTAARKKLSGSAFCGPERSFPAHDAPHARNALARLGQGFPKGASTEVKARIKACVMRKAKKLGVKVEADTAIDTWADPNTKLVTLRTLAAQVDRLESENKRYQVEVREAQEQRDRYKTSVDELQEKHRTLLVENIVNLEVATGRTNVKHLKDAEALKAHKDELVKRELSSLLDSAADLQKELIEHDAVGTQTSSTERTEIPVKGLGGSPQFEEDPKSLDAASKYKKDKLALLKTKAS